MTVYEFIMEHRAEIQALHDAGVNVGDLKYAEIYADIMRLRQDGLKMAYCVFYACDRYNIGEALAWRIIKKMRSEVPTIKSE